MLFLTKVPFVQPSSIINLLSDSEPEIVNPKKKRKRSSSPNSDVEIIASTMKTLVRLKKKKKNKKAVKTAASGSESDSDAPKSVIRITRQLVVPALVTLTEIPSTWKIYNGAYILDLSNDPREWNDSLGNPLSMAAIIKSQVCSQSVIIYGNI